MKRGFFLIGVLAVFFSCNGYVEDEDFGQGEPMNKYSRFLWENRIPIKIQGEKIFMDGDIKSVDLDRFMGLLVLESDVIADNIANYNTTRTYSGNAYRRKFVVVRNGIIDICEDESDYRLVYDPAHPDAVREGEYRGYVFYPNIDIVTEFLSLIIVSRMVEGVIFECEKQNIPLNYPQFIEEHEMHQEFSF
jgi:flagellar basal-body rod protein FlgC